MNCLEVFSIKQLLDIGVLSDRIQFAKVFVPLLCIFVSKSPLHICAGAPSLLKKQLQEFMPMLFRCKSQSCLTQLNLAKNAGIKVRDFTLVSASPFFHFLLI